jgi:hypothetical protein
MDRDDGEGGSVDQGLPASSLASAEPSTENLAAVH